MQRIVNYMLGGMAVGTVVFYMYLLAFHSSGFDIFLALFKIG